MKTTPIFRVLQPKQENGGNYVLLLDVSGSMAVSNGLAILRGPRVVAELRRCFW